MTDQDLLAAYAAHRDHEAFRLLVSRYVDLVYAAAHRQMGDSGAAEDVVQAAFIVLARRGSGIRDARTLGAWLLKVTRLCAAEARRNAARRRKYEQRAAAMTGIPAHETIPDNSDVTAHLDEALSRLRAPDRAALVHRYLREQPIGEVAQSLGITEDSAKKRVARALERLRKIFRKRGIALSMAVLSVAIASQAQAAPPGLAKAAGTTALGGGAAGGPAAIARQVIRRSWRTGIGAAAGTVLLAGLLIAAVSVLAPRSQKIQPPPVASVAVNSSISAASAPDADGKMMSLPQLIAALEARRQRIKSIEWSVTLDVGVVDGKPTVTDSSRYGRSGENEYFIQSSRTLPDTTYVSDGKSMRMLQPIHQDDFPLAGEAVIYPLQGPNAMRQRLFARDEDQPCGFTGEYIWTYELLANLKQGHITLTPHWVEENGVPCYELQGDGIPKEELTRGLSPEQIAQVVPPTFRLLLDPARSLMPRKIEQFNSAASANILDQFEFKEVTSGMWFPVAARQRALQKDAAGADRVLTTNQIHAQVLSINQDIPPARFVLDFPAGTRVLDYTDASLLEGVVHQTTVGNPADKMDYRQLGNGRMQPIFPAGNRGRRGGG